MTITKVINYKTDQTLFYVIHEPYQNLDFIEDTCDSVMTTGASGDNLEKIVKNLITYQQAKNFCKKFI